MSVSFLYYFLMLVACAQTNMGSNRNQPNALHHLNDVQVYYFYDSRLPNEVSKRLGDLTDDLLRKQYAQQVKNGDVVYYKIDLATQQGEAMGRKCNITMTGLVVGKLMSVQNLTQNAYSLVLTDPMAFQQDLAFHINKRLPKNKRVDYNTAPTRNAKKSE